MQIHLARNGQRMGPFPLEEVNRQLALGTVALTDLAWYEGIPTWIPLRDVPGVMPAAGTPPPVQSRSADVASPDSTSLAAPAGTYAGFWIRFLAYVLDGLILGAVGGVIEVVIAAALGTSGSDSTTVRIISNTIGLLLGLCYFSVCWSSSLQASLGQRVCGLRVIGLEGGRISLGRSVMRYLALILSFLILLIGVIMVAFTERKQGLHDMLAGTYVVKA